MNIDELKKEAAEYAVNYIKPGMVIGLGTGSTTLFALKKISQLINNGDLKNIIGIPTSINTEEEAKRLGIPLTTLDEHPFIDLTIDGADEVDKNLNLIKGGGAALLREKIIAQATKQEIIIVDESKVSDLLGTKKSVPVEVVPFALNVELEFLKSLNAKVEVRKSSSGKVLITDEGNYIIDADFGPINKPENIADRLNARAGIVEHGLFIGLTNILIVANQHGIQVQTI